MTILPKCNESDLSCDGFLEATNARYSKQFIEGLVEQMKVPGPT